MCSYVDDVDLSSGHERSGPEDVPLDRHQGAP
jgi:hypothetical protein